MVEKIISEIFIYYKKDYTSNITIDEVKTYAEEKKNKQINEVLNYTVNYYNDTENAIIDFDEIISELRDKENDDSLKCIFTIFDKNSDGFLDTNEMQEVIEFIENKSITIEKVSEKMKNKGKINYIDFLKII